MSFIESSLKVRRSIAKMTDTNSDDWFLCLKARFGLEIVYSAIKEVLGPGNVLTTPYTCITAINPIMAGGLEPQYIDIDPTLLSTSDIPADRITAGTRAIVMQHTLGIIDNKNNLYNIAKRHNLVLIEDSAHCLLRMARGTDDLPLADISAHSFGVEKVLPNTKFGGAIYVNPKLKDKNPQLYDKICSYLITLKQPEAALSFRVRTYRFNNSIIQHLPRPLKNPIRNFAIKTKLLEPAVYDYEQEGRQASPRTTNEYVNNSILKALPGLKSNYDRRRANVKYYREHLQSKKFIPIPQSEDDEPLLAYPIVFENTTFANYAYDLLTNAGFFIRRWYMPLLYPGPKFYQLYYYKPEDCPIAESMSPRVLCLPTDLPASRIHQIVTLLTPVDKPVEKNSASVEKDKISPNA
ncbi:DegT/DnrJ/EryC1/StrS family aminotransferase [Candidatus Saccharibacteria bacterium]|nr:DegT/DnrJ/EryC1/StrS family aminotransferase [Candidatus Saccharibacteria bacterium]